MMSNPNAQWSTMEATQWARQQPWLIGCNFVPSTAVNQLEMWQEDTFDPETIDRELGWAAAAGFNCVRVYLHDLLWLHDRDGLFARIQDFLKLSAGHGISVLLVLFDDCWNEPSSVGAQPEPRPGVHNSRWLQSPGFGIVNDPSQWVRLEAYTRDVIGNLATDNRIVAWDVYNEPGANTQGARSVPLLKEVFRWARESKAMQPLTSGVWNGDAEIRAAQLGLSDVVTFHNYEDPTRLTAQIADLKKEERPVLCTEWLNRIQGSTVRDNLPVFFDEQVGCISWGLVSGKTNTIYAWNSKPGDPEPAVWFHDLFRRDGTPFDTEELALFRRFRKISSCLHPSLGEDWPGHGLFLR